MPEWYEKAAKSPPLKKWKDVSGLGHGEAPKVRFSQHVKVLIRPDPMPKSLMSKFGNKFKRALKETFDDFQMGGLTLVVKDIDVDNMINTLNAFGPILMRQTAGEAGSILHAMLHDGASGATRDMFKDIGKAAVQHMQKAAYRLPKERRRAPPSRSVYGKTPRKGPRVKQLGKYTGERRDPDPGSWVVGGYKPKKPPGYEAMTDFVWWEKYAKGIKEGLPRGWMPGQVYRTKRLYYSIGYKVRSEKEMRTRLVPGELVGVVRMWKEVEVESDIDLTLYIGPGAGNVPAPHYAQAVNEGSEGVRGMHYVSMPNKYGVRGGRRAGFLAYGGDWPGFEGKKFMEDTAQFLIRQKAQFRMNARGYASVHVKSALDRIKGGEGIIQKDFIRKLADDATKIIEDSLSINSQRMIDDIAETISTYYDLEDRGTR